MIPDDFRKGSFRRIGDDPITRRPHIAYMGDAKQVVLTALPKNAHIAFGAGSVDEHAYIIYAALQSGCDHLILLKSDPSGGGKRLKHHIIRLKCASQHKTKARNTGRRRTREIVRADCKASFSAIYHPQTCEWRTAKSLCHQHQGHPRHFQGNIHFAHSINTFVCQPSYVDIHVSTFICRHSSVYIVCIYLNVFLECHILECFVQMVVLLCICAHWTSKALVYIKSTTTCRFSVYCLR